MMAKWYHTSSHRPWVTCENRLAMPTASVAAPPVRPYRELSPTCLASASITPGSSANPVALTLATVSAAMAAASAPVPAMLMAR